MNPREFTWLYALLTLFTAKVTDDDLRKLMDKDMTVIDLLKKVSVYDFVRAVMPSEVRGNSKFRMYIESITPETLVAAAGSEELRNVLKSERGREWLEKTVRQLREWLL